MVAVTSQRQGGHAEGGTWHAGGTGACSTSFRTTPAVEKCVEVVMLAHFSSSRLVVQLWWRHT